MARLVAYVSSQWCPDVARFEGWLDLYEVDGMVVIDVALDPAARERVIGWTGHASVPTLVIAPNDGVQPIAPPMPVRPGQRVRALDRGSILTEPNLHQIAEFLWRNGIAVRERRRGEQRSSAPGPSVNG